MARIELHVKVTGIYRYEREAYARRGTETVTIYKMADDANKVYVWKTTAYLGQDDREVCPNAAITIVATVKGESQYKGEPQTELSRVKVKAVADWGRTWEQIQAEREKAREAKKAEQLASLKGEDFIWRMPYKQYKERYADCETVIDSFNRPRFGTASIEVIIREGRLKASGVRGRHFHSFRLGWEEEDGKHTSPFVAVDLDHAIAQAQKLVGKDIDIELIEQYW